MTPGPGPGCSPGPRTTTRSGGGEWCTTGSCLKGQAGDWHGGWSHARPRSRAWAIRINRASLIVGAPDRQLRGSEADSADQQPPRGRAGRMHRAATVMLRPPVVVAAFQPRYAASRRRGGGSAGAHASEAAGGQHPASIYADDGQACSVLRCAGHQHRICQSSAAVPPRSRSSTSSTYQVIEASPDQAQPTWLISY